jgi:hypothetical protein
MAANRAIRTATNQSPSLDNPVPQAFGHRVQKAPFPPHFQLPNNIAKYIGETNPAIWFEDFWLACQVGGADDDYFIIQYLPI